MRRRRAGDRTFVKVNCAALPSELLESELFGFERGAFTGAIQHKPGKFEFAHHGTMFLDEISEMHRRCSPSCCRCCRTASSRGSAAARTSTSTCASSPRPTAISSSPSRDGQFREDLFFRLNVVCITLPPLRQRRDEIPVLTERFLAALRGALQQARRSRSRATRMRLFAEYDWPGNVRELENLIKRAVILGSDESIRRDLAERSPGGRSVTEPDSRAPASGARAAPHPSRAGCSGTDRRPATVGRLSAGS